MFRAMAGKLQTEVLFRYHCKAITFDSGGSNFGAQGVNEGRCSRQLSRLTVGQSA